MPWILRVEDLFPDAAISVNVINNKLIIKFLYFIEKFLYDKAQHISLISEGFKKILNTKGISEKKISVTPVWVDSTKITPKTSSKFRNDNNLSEKFIVMYSGNMGITSALEDILDAAVMLRDVPFIIFVLIGEGNKKKSIIEFIESNHLINVLVFPYQPRDAYNDLLAAADLGLVTLNPNSSAFSLPSKTFSIMASGRPVFAVTPKNSEISQLIRAENCGINVEPGDPELIAKQIIELASQKEKLKMFSQNGRIAVEEKFSRAVCVNSF